MCSFQSIGSTRSVLRSLSCGPYSRSAPYVKAAGAYEVHSPINQPHPRRASMSSTRVSLRKNLVRYMLMSTLAVVLLRGGIADAARLALNCGQWEVIPNPGQGGLLAVTVVPGTARDVWT